MARLLPSLLLSSSLAASSVLACGGSTGLMNTDSGSGGSSEDGSSLDGTAAGGTWSEGAGGTSVDGISPATGGNGGAGSAGAGGTDDPGPSTGGCCLILLSCDSGDRTLPSETDCPEGADCYSRTACCSQIWCVNEPEATCNALPSCAEGTHEVPSCAEDDVSCKPETLCSTTIFCATDNPPSCGGGPQCPDGTHEVGGCPSAGDCQSVEACGQVVYCVPNTGAECNPDEEHNRKYVTTGGPDSCAAVDFLCDEGTKAFTNDCGCGCEQPSDCPEWVDCMPSVDGGPEALCVSDECPYTLRAY